MIDQIILISTYIFAALLIIFTLLYYVYKQNRQSELTERNIEIAKEEGRHEPLSMYPVFGGSICLKCGSCACVCRAGDVIGYVEGKATLINATHCIGDGA